MRRGLLSLPRELLTLVRTKIHTLRDHVNFSLACRATSDLYDESFWKFACIVSGWGIPLDLQCSLAGERAKGVEIRPYTAIARAIIEDARSFRGDTVDDYQKFALVKSRLASPSLRTKADPEHSQAIFENEINKPIKTRAWAPKEVKKHGIKLKTFPDHTHGGAGGFNLMIGGPADEDDIMSHPYLAYRFLTIPPIKKAFVSSGFGPNEEDYECVINESGVTVQDAFTSLTEE